MDIPDEIWKDFKDKGFDWLWLMGVWHHSPLKKEELQKLPGLIKEIEKALPKWGYSDVIGSPYSIIEYTINPMLGIPGDLILLKQKLNGIGIKLMLDFVPNHYGNASELVNTSPELFVSTKNKPKDKSLFKLVETNKGSRWVAYGKDPYFSPWTDTYQLNYYNSDTQKHMIMVLNQIAKMCDGIRCDMAMLCLNEIISKTWGFYYKNNDIKELKREFWAEAIKSVKSIYPDFIFLAEVYWDLGWRLQQLGFDFTYDKRLYERLEQGDIEFIRGHLNAELQYQEKSMRFIENHDEKRAIEVFGQDRSLTAAIIMGTIPGMSLYHQGQILGEKIKIPVQIRRKKEENIDFKIQKTYDRLLKFSKQVNIQKGQWLLIETSMKDVLAWQWNFPSSTSLNIVVVNYSPFKKQCVIFPNFLNKFKDFEQIKIIDILTDQEIYLLWEEIVQNGILLDLLPYQSFLLNIN